MTLPSALQRCRLLLAVLVLGLAAGCSLEVPTDPDGTFDRVEGGALRAGASLQDELVREDDGAMSGSEVELVERFADSIDADVDWTVAGEESLVGQLETGELDLVVGGITDATPWADRVGLTRGYPGVPGAEGRSLVMLVPPGENRMLVELETFLDKEVG